MASITLISLRSEVHRNGAHWGSGTAAAAGRFSDAWFGLLVEAALTPVFHADLGLPQMLADSLMIFMNYAFWDQTIRPVL
jgi:hypothetical protein